jgi:hypothetical protein
VRRLGQVAPDLVDALAATIGDHSPQGCAAALHAAVDLYRELRDDDGLVRRGAAEAASPDYLAEIEARLAAPDGRSSRN